MVMSQKMKNLSMIMTKKLIDTFQKEATALNMENTNNF